MIRYERRDISDLRPDPANPRTITQAASKALRASLKRFGLVQPVIVNERTGNVVGGHQRVAAARANGETEIDVAVGDWSPADERALNVTLNNLAAQGTFEGVASYLSGVDMGLATLKELRLDVLVLGDDGDEKKSTSDRQLEYRVVISCVDETHQAELLERFDAEGLSAKPLIV
jgi:hypothetical protein